LKALTPEPWTGEAKKMISPKARSIMILSTCVWLPALAACGSSEGDGPDTLPAPTAPAEPPPGTATDRDAPALVTVSPAASQTGVRSDAKIVFTFDEPMDGAKTEAAYASDSLPAAKVTFGWNAAGDVLTVTPKEPLAYAEGDAATAALAYGARIGRAATDRAGNPLPADAVATFTTLRRLTHAAPLVGSLTGAASSQPVAVSGGLLVGDGTNGLSFKGFMTFTLEGMPKDVVEVEKATLTVVQHSLAGAPDSSLGALSLDHISYGALDVSVLTVKPTQTTTVTYVAAAPASRWSTVTPMVADDLANRDARQNRTQYRLSYATPTNGDNLPDGFSVGEGAMKLAIVYLVP
jgi:hypothetical protein